MIGSHSATVFAMLADSALKFISNGTIQTQFTRDKSYKVFEADLSCNFYSSCIGIFAASKGKIQAKLCYFTEQ